MLSKISKNSELISNLDYSSEISKPEIVDLYDTGWLIIRLEMIGNLFINVANHAQTIFRLIATRIF